MQTPPTLAPDTEATRKTHLTHEASLQGVGSLYVLGSALCIFSGLFSFYGATTGGVQGVIIGALLIGLGGMQGWVGLKLRKLDPAARTPATILACLGLLGFPLGTIINGYILYLLQSEKGRTVFSPEYRAVIAATPHIKYKTSLVVWIFLGLLVLLLIGAIVAALSAGK